MASATNISSLPQDITAYQLVPKVLPTPIWLIDKNWAKAFALFIQKEASALLSNLPSRLNSNLYQFLNHKILHSELLPQNCFPSLIKVMEVFNVQSPKKILSIEDIDPLSQQIEDEALNEVWKRIEEVIRGQGITIPIFRNAEEIRSWMLKNQALLQTFTQLDLSYCALTVLPVEIKYLTGLKSVDLSFNKLTALPVEIGHLVNLTKLDLSNNQLTVLPSEIGHLTNLTHLFLSNNQLTILPSETGYLTNLTLLFLSKNQLTILPSETGYLTNLTKLVLSDNQLTALPAEIGQLTNLTELFLSNNQLVSLPAQIKKLKNLTILFLNNNCLTKLPLEIGKLAALTELYLSFNNLTNLVTEIGQLKALRCLLLSGNQLKTLPEKIGQLTNLYYLELNHNQLTSLPLQLGQLKNLQHLLLSNNQLTGFPLEINQSSLFHVDLEDNEITNLECLPPLPNFNLEGNPILFVSEEILNSSCFRFNPALKYYKEARDHLATSALALLYQSVLKREDWPSLKAAFYRLSKDEQNLIYGLVWELAGKPIGDLQWGEHHAFDDLRILGLAVRKMIVTKG